METENVLVRYNLDDFLNHKHINEVLPIELEQYCLTNNSNKLVIREDFIRDMSDIVVSAFHGINPNDILLKTTIRDYMNKICQSNYDEYLEKLQSIKYLNKNHLCILAQDLIDRSMNDLISCKGFDPAKGDIYISDINANIAEEFCKFFIKTDDENTKFKNVISELCQKQFVDFMNPNKLLDSNNRHRVDNFKGFMNFIGLLHNRGIISKKVILICLAGMKKLIFQSDWGEIECNNVFSGFDRLMNQIIYFLSKNNNDPEFLSDLLLLTESIKDDNDIKQKLRKIPMLTHENILNKLKDLQIK